MPDEKQIALQQKQENEKRDKILKVYADLAKKLRRHVKMNDLVDSGYTKDTVTHYFRSLTRLSEEAREKYPDSFHDIAVKDILEPKTLQQLEDTVKKYNKFVITTAVTSCSADVNFLKSIQSYCTKHDAALLVLVASDPAHNKEFGKDHGSFDKEIIKYGGHIVITDTAMNSNLYLSTIKLSAKHIDPITGLGRIGQRNGSFIYASPKQRLKAVPVSNSKLPHFLMTTGAVTKPNYASGNYMSDRTAYIADNDHVMGALVVEIVDNKIYHFRQVQADKDGSFIDLAHQYSSDGKVTYVEPEAFVLGDWHSGQTDPKASKAFIEVIKAFKIKTVVLHDAFDGLSINHHEEKQLILLAQRAEKKQLDLKNEMVGLAKDLNMFNEIVDQVVMVKSNHDEFLERYLQSGKYVEDPQNHRIALQLALAMLDGEDPLKHGVEMLGLKEKSKVLWLKRDEDFKIARIQLGAHGDKGANGSKGSLQAIESAYGQSVSGHSHTPEILRGAWQVGTTSLLKQEYNKGPSSWLHTSCLVYPNGSRQLINVINGKWCK